MDLEELHLYQSSEAGNPLEDLMSCTGWCLFGTPTGCDAGAFGVVGTKNLINAFDLANCWAASQCSRDSRSAASRRSRSHRTGRVARELSFLQLPLESFDHRS